MKHQIFFRESKKQRNPLATMLLAVFMLSAALFTACDNKNPLVEQQTEETETLNTEVFKFSYNGKLYESKEFEKLFKDKEFPLMVTGTSLPEKNVIYVYDSEADYQNWAQSSPFAGKLAQVEKKVAEARINSDSNPTSPSKSSGIGGWAQLFDYSNYSGTDFYAYATSILSSLSRFDNKASSVRVYNPSNSFATICSLYMGSGFQGSQFIIINQNSNYTYYFNLTSVSGWSNVTSSFIVL